VTSRGTYKFDINELGRERVPADLST